MPKKAGMATREKYLHQHGLKICDINKILRKREQDVYVKTAASAFCYFQDRKKNRWRASKYPVTAGKLFYPKKGKRLRITLRPTLDYIIMDL